MGLSEDPIGIKSGASRVTVKTLVEITDLLSEGEIDGLVSLEYELAGTVGQTGWTTILTKSAVPSLPSSGYLNSVYLNDVPLLSKEGQFNFQDIQFSKAVGTPNGEFSSINLLRTETKRTMGVNERLRGPSYNVTTKQRIGAVDQFAKYYKILNKDCSSIEVNIKLSSLSFVNRADEANVKVTDTTVDYIVDYRPLYSNSISALYFRGATVSLEGRITSPYIESTRVDFLSNLISDVNAFLGWEIKIYRITSDPLDSDTQNSTFIDSISEIFGSKFSYPNSALASFNFDAEYFSQIPARSYDARLLKVKIPSNYDPLRKIYSGNWDGVFQTAKAWTDNPAWCFYDLITNPRYGLGKHIDSQLVDKWTLYEIGQYCDVLVPDGFGNIEPRFTSNLMLQSREDAYKVVNDVASIFRGISYYAAGNIYVNQDSDKKRPIYQFTNANVEDGEFLYSSSSAKLRHNVAIVRYNDKTNLYKPAIEYAQDIDGIRKNGIREVELSAFGCTSRGQASRLGRWVLFTENLETETVGFTAGLEANYLRPGDVVSISDQNRNVRRRGGRLSNFNSTAKTLTLDSALSGVNSSSKYFISILTPSFFYDTSIVDLNNSSDIANIRRSHVQNFYLEGSNITVGENSTVVNLTPNFPSTANYSLLTGAIWTISLSGNEQGNPFPSAGTDFSDLDELSSRNETFRVLSIEESETNKYKVSAIEYNPLKFTAIESGLSFDSSYSNVIPSTAASVAFSVTSAGNSKILNYTITSASASSSLVALSNYIVYAKSSASQGTNPWKNGDYRENNPGLGGSDGTSIDTNSFIPDSRYKIATLSAASALTVISSFVPSENNVYYYFKIFAANSSNATSNALSSVGPIIEYNEPIKDVIIKNLRLSSDLATTNAAGQKNTSASLYDQASPTFNFNWGFDIVANSIFASNFQYRLTFRPKSENNAPSSSKFFQVTGFSPTDSLSPNYTFELLSNINSNSQIPLREYDVIVEAHDGNGNSSAGGNFVTSTDSAYNNSNGYDILTVNNPRISNVLINENRNCPSNSAYCTEQFFTYEKEIKIHLTSIPAEFSDAAGGFVYVSHNSFSNTVVQGKTIAECQALGIEVLEFTEFTNPITVRPTSSDILKQSKKNYIAYSLYDTFDKNWRSLVSTNPKLEKYQTVSAVAAAIRPETRAFGGEGDKVWILIDIEAKYFKSYGISRIEVLTLDGMNASHPYRLFKGFRKYRCDNRSLYSYPNTVLYDYVKEEYQTTNHNITDTYCGYNEPRIINGEFQGDEAYPGTNSSVLTDHRQWVRIRCYFDDNIVTVPYNKQTNGSPVTDSIYNPYSTQGTLYEGNYHVMGSNARNRSYRTINDAIVSPLLSKTVVTAGNVSNGLLIDAYFQHFDNNPEYNHHPAGFGQGFGGLEKNTKYFDVHMGRLVDHGFLTAAFFGIVWSTDDVQERTI